MALLLELIMLLLLREQLRWQLKLLRLMRAVLRLLRRWRQSQTDEFHAAGYGVERPGTGRGARPVHGDASGPSGLDAPLRARRARHRLPGIDRVDQRRGIDAEASGAGPLSVPRASWQPRGLYGGGAAGPARPDRPRCASRGRQA